MSRRRMLLSIIILSLASQTFVYSQPFHSELFDCLQWRMIGPHRGGRTVGAVGVPQHPNIFYIGVNNGGVWKTSDFGRTWQPIFDDQPTGSIGDVAVAGSDPNVIYVGSGEGLQRPDLSVGDGIYKSTDGGKNWSHLGLQNGQQIAGLAIDPKNENHVFAAILGHPYGANPERGVYRTTDGGATWHRSLYVDENTGGAQVTIDPQNPSIVFADLWAARLAPWENGYWQGPGSGLYKSTNGGSSWKKLTNGLPTFEQGLGRIGCCIAPSDPRRMYATVDAATGGGMYRSDDAGESWKRISDDIRLWDRGDDFAECKVDPKNPDRVYVANIVTWKSEDGGTTWTGFRGAPGGDDYHRIWINPDNPDIILLASDQGAIITVNGGRSWSSWYNQPTAQFYHVSTDNSFPYNVYGGQQESGSAGVASRGNDGQITFREWHPVGAEEYGYVAPDPLDPNIIYGGKLSKYDKHTGQVQNIFPAVNTISAYRFLRTAPVLFSPLDPKTMYFAGNVLFKTEDRGHSWEIISPDLSRETWAIPENIGVYRTDEMKSMPRRGVIYAVAPSPKDINTIWAGTDDGLIHVTHDGGKSWKNVTPPDVTPWSKISVIEASRFDAKTAYAAVNRIRLDDMHPYIYRTRDGGLSWQEIVNGLPDDPINAVREDPARPGLLFSGSERAVSVSFDGGEHWQSLRLNMPATSIRDLVIKDDDLVIATHGRSFWILDDITPLRQLTGQRATESVILFSPQKSYRVRWNMNTDTPLPQEEPAGKNPPEGAIINYYLRSDCESPVTLEILDAKGSVVRRYSSADSSVEIPAVNIPLYWIRPQQVLSAKAGSHRFLWDLHLTPLPAPSSFPMSAIYRDTPAENTSPWAMPGEYTVRLRANAKTYEQPLTLVMDPRVTTSREKLQEQYDLSLACYEARRQLLHIQGKSKSLQQRIKHLIPALKPPLLDSLTQFSNRLADFDEKIVQPLNSALGTIFSILHDSDMPPTSPAERAVIENRKNLETTVACWTAIQTSELSSINRQLRQAGHEPIAP